MQSPSDLSCTIQHFLTEKDTWVAASILRDSWSPNSTYLHLDFYLYIFVYICTNKYKDTWVAAGILRDWCWCILAKCSAWPNIFPLLGALWDLGHICISLHPRSNCHANTWPQLFRHQGQDARSKISGLAQNGSTLVRRSTIIACFQDDAPKSWQDATWIIWHLTSDTF